MGSRRIIAVIFILLLSWCIFHGISGFIPRDFHSFGDLHLSFSQSHIRGQFWGLSALILLGILGLAHILRSSEVPFFSIIALLSARLRLIRKEAPKENKSGKPDTIADVRIDKAGVTGDSAGFDGLLRIDLITIETWLRSSSPPEAGGIQMLEGEIESVRRHIALEMGFVLPLVKIKQNPQIKKGEYVIKIKGVEAARGEVHTGRLFAIGTDKMLAELRGIKAIYPVWNMPGIWITGDLRVQAESLGCMIFGPISFIKIHCTEVIRANAALLLGYQQTEGLIEGIRRTDPALLSYLDQHHVAVREIRKVLQNLLGERVSIRDLVTILETMANNAGKTNDPDELTECARLALSRAICREHMNAEGVINVISIDPEIQELVSASIKRTESGAILAIDPDVGQKILIKIGCETGKLLEKGLRPVILCAPRVRPAIKCMSRLSFPDLVVLSWNEIAPRVNVNSVGMISLHERQDSASKDFMSWASSLELDPGDAGFISKFRPVPGSPEETELFESFVSKGDRMATRGNLDEALESYRKALGIQPLNYNIYRNIVNILMKKGDFEVAIEEYMDWAQSLQNAGNFNASLMIYAEALSLESQGVKKTFLYGQKPGAGDEIKKLVRKKKSFIFHNIGNIWEKITTST